MHKPAYATPLGSAETCVTPVVFILNGLTIALSKTAMRPPFPIWSAVLTSWPLLRRSSSWYVSDNTCSIDLCAPAHQCQAKSKV